MMRLIAGRRTWAAKADAAVIGPGLDRALGQLRLGAAGALGQRRRAGGDIEYHPVPPAAAGRRVRIEHVDGEALGGRRRAAPAQLRRKVAAGATVALVPPVRWQWCRPPSDRSWSGSCSAHSPRLRPTRRWL